MTVDVLLLNRNYQALRVIDVQRTFKLLIEDRAEVLEVEEDANGHARYYNFGFADWAELSRFKAEFEPDQHDWIRTVRCTFAIPRIIRLFGYDRLPKQTVRLSRRNVFARDGNRCQYCGRRFPTNELSLDHVFPRTQGGKTTWDNLVCCCVKCNVRKGGRTPEQANMKLHTKPVQPKRAPVIDICLGQPRYKSWKQFLSSAYWDVQLID